MSVPNEDAIKVRVPTTMKLQLQKIADKRLCSVSDIAREAILQYLQARPEEYGISPQVSIVAERPPKKKGGTT